MKGQSTPPLMLAAEVARWKSHNGVRGPTGATLFIFESGLRKVQCHGFHRHPPPFGSFLAQALAHRPLASFMLETTPLDQGWSNRLRVSKTPPMIKPPPSVPVEPISDGSRSESLKRTMAARPEGEPIRVFAYGSLLWDPCFEFETKTPARLPGWVRRTCLWTVHARGSLECPGLFYGLDAEPDNACDGAVYALSPEHLDDGLDRLWRREMHAGVYEPLWLDLETNAGPARALAFVVNRDHPQYTGAMELEAAAQYIATAHGKFGSCADYYAATAAALRAEGLADPDLFALTKRVEARTVSGR